MSTAYITVNDLIYDLFKEQADRIRELESALARTADQLASRPDLISELVKILDNPCRIALAENVRERIDGTILYAESQCM